MVLQEQYKKCHGSEMHDEYHQLIGRPWEPIKAPQSAIPAIELVN
jgi:hypothetical protein